MLKSKPIIISVNGLQLIANVEETFNNRNGDIDTIIKVQFSNKNCEDIGVGKIKLYGNHQYITGDYNGKRLTNKHRDELLRQLQIID